MGSFLQVIFCWRYSNLGSNYCQSSFGWRWILLLAAAAADGITAFEGAGCWACYALREQHPVVSVSFEWLAFGCWWWVLLF